MPDLTEHIAARIREARAARERLRVVGGGTKSFLGRRIEAAPLEVAAHAGIVDHVPEELVLTARAGTTIAALAQALAAHGQLLGFEPPQLGGAATLGGTLACNLSGPARPWRGSVRDAVLGVRLVNGRGETLRFGGRVIKNVAGFDVARLQAGAHGAFGVLTEVSLKVLPQPERETTISQSCDGADALERMTSLAGLPEPITGAAWLDGTLRLRLSGTDAGVAAARGRIGGDVLPDVEAQRFWHELANLALPFFAGDAPLWRWSVSRSLPVAPSLGPWLLDWGGAQRFSRGHAERSVLEQAAGGGHVSCLRGPDELRARAPAPSAAVRGLQTRLKQAFDPDRVLNPGLLYEWM